MDVTSLDEAAFRSIAKLPSREVLNGQLAGVVASPLTGLVRGLGSMIQGLALQLGQIAEKGLVTGEAPAAEAAGPVSDSGLSLPGESSESSPPAGEAEEADTEDAPAANEKAEGAEEASDDETSNEDSNEEEG